MKVSKGVIFAGYDCVKVENRALSLWITQSLGPRIIGLALKGRENIFAELPETTIDCPGRGVYHLRGGHRLWIAPEDPRYTYLPDNEPVLVRESEAGVKVVQPVDVQLGIQKSLTIYLEEEAGEVIVEHHLQNLNQDTVELAPWAITQLKPGGVAILPQASTPVDHFGVLPNRQITLWPYTEMNFPQISWGDRYIFVRANMNSGALKIGFPNTIGWLGYVLGDTLFVKTASFLPGESYFDMGSSSECYCNPLFLELETLGPRTWLKPGEITTHRETWKLYEQVDFSADEESAKNLIEKLKI